MALKRVSNAAPAAGAAKSGGSVNFGDDSFYSGGFTLAKGRWAMFFDVRLYKHEKSKRDTRLGTMAKCFNMSAPAEEPHQQFFSFGDKAHLSFQPNAAGTGLDPIPGGPSQTIGRMTNWDYFRRSLVDCGLPKGVFTDDISVLNGIWVETDQIDEPQERKDLRTKKTGEEDGEEQKGPNKIVIALQLIPGGKPWEGGGGWPIKAGQAPAAAPARPAAVAHQAAPAAEASGDVSPEELAEAVSSIVSDVLAEGMNSMGMKKLALQLAVLTKLKNEEGDEVAYLAATTIFNSADGVNAILKPLGYELQNKGADVGIIK